MTRQSDQRVSDETDGTSTASTDQRLRGLGIDPNRAAVHRLGWPKRLLWHGYPPWVRPMLLGLGLWAAIVPIEAAGWELPAFVRSVASLIIGLLVLTSACDALVTATERLAARRMWDHYIAGTLAEMLSTLPELVVICFVGRGGSGSGPQVGCRPGRRTARTDL